MSRPDVRSDVHPDTLLVTAGRPRAAGAPLNHGIAPASNFRSDGERWYARPDGTETIDAFEEVMGALEGGRAVSFASGMAACAAALSIVPPGATVAHSAGLYHGAAALLGEAASSGRIELTPIEPENGDGWRDAVAHHELVWLETPTNPLLEVIRLDEVCAATPRRARIVVDSTFATPLGQHPLALGADIVVHSATKFIGGHSDLMAGVVVTDDPDLGDHVMRHRLVHGAVPGALEAFLALRGVRTLSVRLQRAVASAATIAARLTGHASVKRVRYPGLASHPGHDAAARFMENFGAVLAFEMSDDNTADRFLEALGMVVHATSLGGVETSAERRSGYPDSEHLPPGLVRVSVGCEHVEDLWADIAQALDEAH